MLNTLFKVLFSGIIYLTQTKLMTHYFLGGCKNLCLMYKLEEKDAYDEGENSLYTKMKVEKLWMFESAELITRLKFCFTKNHGCNKNLINLISKHYPIKCFIDIELMKKVLTSTVDEMTLESYDTISNLSLLLVNSYEAKGLQEYTDQLCRELLLRLDYRETILSEKLLHEATLNLLILANAFETSLLVHDFHIIISKCLGTIRKITTQNCSTFINVKIVETFINVRFHLYSCYRCFYLVLIYFPDCDFLYEPIFEIAMARYG